MAIVVSFINMKGGVGKTTLLVNVGYALAELHDKRVLLVDIDPQFNASTYLMDENEYLTHMQGNAKHTILDIFMPNRLAAISTVIGKTKPAKKPGITISSCTARIYEKGKAHLDLIPSTLALMQIQTSERLTESRLHNFLKKVDNAYDFILIDCPPTISIYSQAAILASHKYLVPIKPDPLSQIGLPLLERWLGEFTDGAGIDIDSAGIVFTMVRGPVPANMQKIMDGLRKERGSEVFDSFLGQSTKVAESVEAHLPIHRYSPSCKWARQTFEITEEFLTKM
jgi:chromosome partitioning protein